MLRRVFGVLVVSFLFCACPPEEEEAPRCEQAGLDTGFGLRVDFLGRVDGDGGTATGGATLFTAPPADVTVPLAVREQFEVTPTSLTFTPENWNAPQTITVRAKPGVRTDELTEGTTTSLIVGPTQSSEPSLDCQFGFTGFIPLPRCGDGVVDTHRNETCEPPLTRPICAQGEASCLRCGPECTLVPGAPNVCGDGQVTADEECDGPTTRTCTELGFDLGVVSCRADTCAFDTTNCVKLACDGGVGCDPRFPETPAADSAACLLGGDARARCWGASGVGHQRPPALALRQLADGLAHACGLGALGDVHCWGNDTRGQSTPPIAGGPYTKVVVGDLHSCALTVEGEVQCWGDDAHRITRAPPGPFIDLASGSNHACALTPNGAATCWGRRAEGQTFSTGTFTKLAAGANQSCGLTALGAITCWGNFEAGRRPLEFTWPWPFVDLVVLRQDVCALSADGRVVCPDINLGDLALPDGFVPVSLGDASSGLCALDAQGHAVCWGRPEAHRPLVGAFTRVDTGSAFCGTRADGTASCGDATVTSEPLRQLIQADRDTSCAVTLDGGTACTMRWSSGGVDRSAAAPAVPFTRLVVFDEVACGQRPNGAVLCWGNVANGGTGVPVEPLADFAHNGVTGCGVLSSDGQLACWGADPFGIRTPPSGSFRQVRMNRLWACALRVDGRLTCWGEGPPATPDSADFTALAMNENGGHCALHADAGLECWGTNHQTRVPRESFVSLQGTAVNAAGRTRDGGLHHFDDATFEPDRVALVEARVDALVVGRESFCARHGAGVLCLSPNSEIARPLRDVEGDAFSTDTPGDQCWLVDGGYPRCNFGGAPLQTPMSTLRVGGRRFIGVTRDGGELVVNTSRAAAGPYLTVEASAGTYCARRDVTGAWDCVGVVDAGVTRVTPPLERVTIAATDDLACGVTSAGAATCWGRGTTRPMASVPAGEWADLRLGRTHGCGLRPDASVQCWGEATEPSLLQAPSGAFVEVGSGDGFSCAVRAGSRELVCWGRYGVNTTR